MTNIGAYRWSVGCFDVFALNDGHLRASDDLMLGATPSIRHQATLEPEPPYICVNAFLARSEGRTWLFDAGCGRSYGPRLGFTGIELKRLGIGPDEVDAVLMTHLHGDHANGLIDEQDRPVYPRADLFVARAEYDFWMNDARVAAAPPRSVASVDRNRLVLSVYGARLHLFEPGEVLPAIEAVPLPGHTPGHTGWRLSSGGETLLIWGDIVHIQKAQLAEPSISMVFDVDPELAGTTRRDLLARVAAERSPVAGIHLDFPGVGRIVRAGDGYRFDPCQWVRDDREGS